MTIKTNRASRVLWATIKGPHASEIGGPEEEQKRQKEYLKKQWQKTANLLKNINLHIKETLCTPNPKGSVLGLVLVQT